MRPSGRIPTSVGLRELNKIDKRERIRAAASEMFSDVGYDAATLRQIADRARVGLGTLFNYVSDKRDLVFLIFNEEMEALISRALAAAISEETIHAQVLEVFAQHYRFFANNTNLSRIFLRELLFFSEGKHAIQYLSVRAKLLKGLERLVQAADARGQIRLADGPELTARHIFFTASSAIRWWLAGPNPEPTSGIHEYSRLLAMQINGLDPDGRIVVPNSSSAVSKETK